MNPTDRARFEQSASPEAIERRLAHLRRKRASIQAEMVRLERLLIRRSREIAAGIWPPKPEKTTQQPAVEDGNQQADPEGSSS